MLTLPIISEDQKQQFREEGFFVLENVIPEEHLQILRDECAAAMGRVDRDLEAEGVEKRGLNHKGKRYFMTCYNGTKSPDLKRFLFSDVMAEICRATLGEMAYLFNEQYVVKAGEVGMSFSWHQDSAYLGQEHRPYLTCWCALDDVTEDNGTVYILPFSKAGTKDLVVHQSDEKTNDLVGYSGDDPGVPVTAPAGSIAVLSSTTLHRSGANQTQNLRRVYVVNYSVEPILKAGNSANWNMAEPFLLDGERVEYGNQNDN